MNSSQVETYTFEPKREAIIGNMFAVALLVILAFWNLGVAFISALMFIAWGFFGIRKLFITSKHVQITNTFGFCIKLEPSQIDLFHSRVYLLIIGRKLMVFPFWFTTRFSEDHVREKLSSLLAELTGKQPLQ